MPSLSSLITHFPNDDIQKDWKHAERIFRDNNYALSPKRPFLYHVVFKLNSSKMPSETKDLSLLVKNVSLPSFSMDVETLNRYNRKTNIQTKIEYSPVSITFHDDASNVVRNMWENYYIYYYKDGQYREPTQQLNNPYEGKPDKSRWGYDTLGPGSRPPFFNHIEIFSFDQRKFSSYKLVNPILTDFKHGQHDYSDQGGLEHSMTINYESVIYDKGFINSNRVDGFAEFNHYDHSPSTLTIAGGGTDSVFGPGGFLQGAGDILGSLADGNVIGAVLGSINLYDNVRDANIGKMIKNETRQIANKTIRGAPSSLKRANPIVVPFSNFFK